MDLNTEVSMNLIERLDTLERRLSELESIVISNNNLVNEKLDKLGEVVGLEKPIKKNIKVNLVYDETEDDEDDPNWRIFTLGEERDHKYFMRMGRHQSEQSKKPYWSNFKHNTKTFDSRKEATEFMKQNKIKNAFVG